MQMQRHARASESRGYTATNGGNVNEEIYVTAVMRCIGLHDRDCGQPPAGIQDRQGPAN
jgi:hypothetical protein